MRRYTIMRGRASHTRKLTDETLLNQGRSSPKPDGSRQCKTQPRMHANRHEEMAETQPQMWSDEILKKSQACQWQETSSAPICVHPRLVSLIRVHSRPARLWPMDADNRKSPLGRELSPSDPERRFGPVYQTSTLEPREVPGPDSVPDSLFGPGPATGFSACRMKTMVSTLASVALVACSVCPDNRGTKASTSEIAHNVRVPKVISKSVASKSMSLAEPIFVLTRGRHPWSAASLARPWQARGTVMHTFFSACALCRRA